MTTDSKTAITTVHMVARVQLAYRRPVALMRDATANFTSAHMVTRVHFLWWRGVELMTKATTNFATVHMVAIAHIPLEAIEAIEASNLNYIKKRSQIESTAQNRARGHETT